MKNEVTVRFKSGRISFQWVKKTMWTVLFLSVAALILFIASLSVGSSYISPVAVAAHLLGYGDGSHEFVLNTLRLPRAILAFMVGTALGTAGLILQGIIRNPLASPDIIGITSGASVGAIIFIAYVMGTVSIIWLPLWAIGGAAAAALLIYSLSWKKGVTPIRLVLMGIGIAALMKAFVTMTLVMSEAAVTTKAYIWLTGSLYGAAWTDVYAMLPWLLLFIPAALLYARLMNALELGDDVAKSLGIGIEVQRFGLLLISVVLAGSAVAFAGGIEFVGLIAPHIGRMLVGRSYAGLVLVSALTGGLLVMAADIVARTAFLPLDVPAGVFTAAIGAPFFIYLLYRNRNHV